MNTQHGDISTRQIAEDITARLAAARLDAEVLAVGPELTEHGGNPAAIFAGAIVRHNGQDHKISVPEHWDAERRNRIGNRGALVRDWHMLAAHVVAALSR